MKDMILEAKLRAIEETRFVQVPGPNPLLIPGEPGSWDDGMLEMCDVLKDNGKYYLYYHATGRGESYRIGVAVADSPLGPFRKYGDAPILDLTGFGNSGNDRYIACGSVFKEAENRYYLYYSLQQRDDQLNYYIGFATAEHPLGPWQKSEKNPILVNFGYVGGVTKKDGKYYMFNEYPTRVQACDYGHISVAVADSPEGPWEACKDAPVMPVESWGTWDDAGYSESKVSYDGNLFGMFYGGAKTHPSRLLSQESIGYAYSVDGKQFEKYGKNPVARREEIYYGAAMAECCYLAEYPYIYVYHTLRYTKPWLPQDSHKFPSMEHIGVQVLSVGDRFTVPYTVYEIPTLAAGAEASCLTCGKLPLSIGNAERFSLTVRCTYPEGAGIPRGITVALRCGDREEELDTVDSYCFSGVAAEGKTVQCRFCGELCARFADVIVRNSNGFPLTDVSVSITLKG